MIPTIDLRKSVQGETREGKTICAHGIVHDFWGIQVEQRGPRNRVKTLEHEHDCYISVDEALGSTVRVIGVELGETTNDEETRNEQSLREHRRGLATPTSRKLRPEDAASQTPYVEDNILAAGQ